MVCLQARHYKLANHEGYTKHEGCTTMQQTCVQHHSYTIYKVVNCVRCCERHKMYSALQLIRNMTWCKMWCNTKQYVLSYALDKKCALMKMKYVKQQYVCVMQYDTQDEIGKATVSMCDAI